MSSIKNLTNYFQTVLKSEEYKKHTLYAIVDSGINKEFTKVLHMQEDDTYAILLKESLAQKVEKVAPYLVKLNLEEEYTQKLMKKGFATNWLTYIISYKTLNELTEELKEMIMPYSEQHQREILFRFYDPRNLENYILMHEVEELIEMFDDVGGGFFIVEVNNKKELKTYALPNVLSIINLEEQ